MQAQNSCQIHHYLSSAIRADLRKMIGQQLLVMKSSQSESWNQTTWGNNGQVTFSTLGNLHVVTGSDLFHHWEFSSRAHPDTLFGDFGDLDLTWLKTRSAKDHRHTFFLPGETTDHSHQVTTNEWIESIEIYGVNHQFLRRDESGVDPDLSLDVHLDLMLAMRFASGNLMTLIGNERKDGIILSFFPDNQLDAFQTMVQNRENLWGERFYFLQYAIP
ncbi:MAG: hypothetical protein KDC54_16720 [Lewinella sp.]|nr:hypothetical protein [Lewinella sp.]